MLLMSPLAAQAGGGFLRLSPHTDRYDLSPFLEVLEDPSAKLTLAQVTSPPWRGRFVPLGPGGIHPGVTGSAFWLRLTLAPPAGPRPGEYILDLGQVFLTYGRAYLSRPEGGGPPAWRELTARNRNGGAARLPSRFIHFPLDLPPGGGRTLVFQLRSPISLSLNPVLAGRVSFNNGLMQEMLTYGAFLGLLLGLACYHLVIYISLRDVSYLWYVLMILMAIIYFAGMNGLMLQATGPEGGFLDLHLPMVALALMFACRILFAKSFLPLREFFAWGNRWLSVLLAVFLVLSVLTALDATRNAGVRVFMILGLVFPFAILAAGWACWRGGFAPARYFFWAYLLSGLGVIVFITGMLWGVSTPFALHHAHQMGLSAEAVLLALALGHRVKALRRQREELQSRAQRETRLHQRRLSRLVEELVRVGESERRSIAEDLHDSVTQDLAAGLWSLRGLRPALARDAGREMDEVCRTLNKALEDLRSLTFEISPPELYDHGLPAALAALARSITLRHGLAVEYRGPEAAPRLALNQEQALFRMLRELALNAAKHARAGRAVMDMEFKDGRVRASLRDDGVGFPPGWDRSGRKPGFGLFSIRERLAIMGGGLTVDSAPGRGSLVTLDLPLRTAG